MPRKFPYAPEVRERAVRMVSEHRAEYASEWATITFIARKLSVHRETLRAWIRQSQRDTGQRPGLTTEERGRLTAPRYAAVREFAYSHVLEFG